MKKNSWKTLLSVVLLLTMLVSMLPSAAFAEDGQTAAAQAEEPAKTAVTDAPKDADAPKEAAAEGETKGTPKGGAEGAAQAETLQAQPLASQTATLIYKANGGTGEDHVEYGSAADGSDIVFFKAWNPSGSFIAPDGKEFIHWKPTPDGAGETFHPDEVINVPPGESLTLYAQWTPTSTAPDWSKLKIEKTVDKTTAGLGNTLTYTIKVTNNTGYDLSYLCVEDPVPADTIFDEASQTSGNWRLSGGDTGTAKAELLNGLAGGTSETFTVKVMVGRDVPSGKVENTATITAAESGSAYSLTDTHPNGITSSTVTTVIDPMFNLDISVRAIQPVAEVGEDHKFTYQVTVRNNGVWLAAAKIENILPTGVGAIVGEPDQNCGFSSDYSTVDIYSIPKDESVSYTITTNFVPGGAVTAVLEAKIVSVTTQAENTYTGSKSAEAAVCSLAGLTIEKSVDLSSAKPGDTLNYTVKVTNNTDADLDEVYVNDYLPGAVTYTDKDISTVSGGNLTFKLFPAGEMFVEVPGLKKGETAEYTVKAAVNAGTSGEIESHASVSSVVYVYDGGSHYTAETSINSNTVTTTLLTEVPVNVTVIFDGLEDVSQVPAGYKLTGAAGNAFLKGEIGLLPAVNNGGQITRTFTATADVLLGQEYSLSFTQSGLDIDGYVCKTDAAVSTTVTADKEKGITVDLTVSYTKLDWSKLTITKTADKTYAQPGAYVKYTITVANNMGVDLTDVNVLDYLPANVRYSSSFGGYDSGTGSWTIAGLAPGASRTLTIRVKLNSGLTNGTVIENTAYITGVTIDGQEYGFENLWLNDSAKVTVTDGKGSPKTGDESNLGLWIAVMAASLACAGTAAVIYKKRRG